LFQNARFDRVRELFVDQFEADGNGYIYRRNSKGPAIRVTSAERDMFIADFSRSLNRLWWGLILGMVVAIGGCVAWFAIEGGDVSEWSIWIGLLPVFVLYMLFWRRAWNAPTRKLATRSQVAPERSKDEFRRLMLQRLTWGRLGGAAASFAIAMFYLGRRFNLLVGWNRLWLVLAGVAFLALLRQAFRKWQFDRSAGVGQ